MPETSSPTSIRSLIAASDLENFFVAIHFSKTDLMGSCVRLAYRDLQRTVRGIAKFNKGNIPERVRALVLKAREADDQEQFDAWHRSACDDLVNAFRSIGYERFTVGQAQKWLNMTLKYIILLGDRVPGFSHILPFCHVPLDSYVMKAAVPLGMPVLPKSVAWSTLTDYDLYMDGQRWFRDRFTDAPIVTEFRLWLGHVIAMRQP